MNEEDDSSYEMIFKTLIIGDTNVGKSNLLLRYVKNDFSSEMKSTVGVEFGSKILKILGINVKVQI
jgi:GTPase SAR1 family protein